MKKAIVTGSLGLVGSYVSQILSEQSFYVIGIDCDVRAQLFPDVSFLTHQQINQLNQLSGVDEHHSIDIRDQSSIDTLISQKISDGSLEIIIHCAAQPSHDWASSSPLTDLNINLLGTVYILETLRKFNYSGLFVHLSTNKVYGDIPNSLPLDELDSRYDLNNTHPFYMGIDTSMSIDNSTHSLFGCSKASADLYVQEYSRYFGLKALILRGGCLTGSRHRGAMLHGFLSYLVKTAINKDEYNILGYKGKQVRDNLHAKDIGHLVTSFFLNKANIPSDKYPIIANLGGGRDNSVSILETIDILSSSFGLKFPYKFVDEPRIGDHQWYISDFSNLSQLFGWKPSLTIHGILEDIINNT
ncbi:CDP-paratose 2-epimerase [Prochlorococcus marinus str. MIT 1313]|uniref:NAD-dependent epimerase/dehydratase family protein n=1 Tax=Prochlorococcus TaxID=1218 RepID=UPI0007B36847|nr:NAD-dependent epimerase/dehydratase family protein [Prochlorococcus marinus]KZR70252.1 CDP-paratose 2-epimerase [Prochlorococcus marinus str. MIT 1313]KZR70724.1 CDP-paratose 2-epimerase [Prochlorococcus marinus str. MIT 1318]